MIPFNKPFLTGNETAYITEAVQSGKISGNGEFSQKCHAFFEKTLGVSKCLLTTSCTDALEMSAILLGLSVGDEVIVPSYTFVSTANAFILHGAKVVFCDSSVESPNIDASKIESLITRKTKAIVVVHYAGVACEMDSIVAIGQKYNIPIIEDAAQAIDSFYKGKPLGSIGDLSAFSFHETKNVICGEGGLLSIGNPVYSDRSEIIWEKGTNRSAFFRGEVDKYGWVDVGASFLPSEVLAAFLFAQLENLHAIQNRRIKLWERYRDNLTGLSVRKGDVIPGYATNNAHMYYLVCENIEERTRLIEYLKSKGIHSVFHYLPLHSSLFYKSQYTGASLPNADIYGDCIIRLPLYYELTISQVDMICSEIIKFYQGR